MSLEHRCFAGGMLVSNDHWIPVDPMEFGATGSIVPAVGCNRMRCRQCHCFIRVWHGLRPDSEVSPDAAELYATVDASTIAGVRRERLMNLYGCRCRQHVEHTTRSIDDYDELHSLDLPWACAGHPLPVFPLQLDGDPIDHVLGVGDLLSARLPRKLHPAIRDLAGFQAVRVHRLLAQVDQQEAFAVRVSELLTDSDPCLRRGALGYYRLLPAATGSELVLKLRHKRSLWSAVDPTDTQVTLDWTLRLSLAAITRNRRELERSAGSV